MRVRRALFERKTLPDLYGSVIGGNGKQGRLWKQMDRLVRHEDKVVGILVTGDMGETYDAMRSIDVPFDSEVVYSAVGYIMSKRISSQYFGSLMNGLSLAW